MDLSYRKNWPQIKPVFGEKDYCYLGGESKIKRKILQSNSRWRDFMPIYELQRNRKGDVFGCVSFADNNIDEFLHKRKYGSEININDRVVVVGSGTKPNIGNNPTAVSEWKRKNGIVLGEEKWPYTKDMTVTEYYNNYVVPAHLLKEGKENLKVYSHGYEWVDYAFFKGAKTTSSENIIKGMQYSPIEASVHGLYEYDDNGYVKWTGKGYTHEIAIFDYDDYGFWVFDSEAETIVKFRRDYPFGWPLIKYFEKKTIKTSPYILKGNALSVLGKGGRAKGKYRTYADGEDYKFFCGDNYPSHPDVEVVTEDPENMDKEYIISRIKKQFYLDNIDKIL